MINALQACKLIERRNSEKERLKRLKAFPKRIDDICGDHRRLIESMIAKQEEVVQQIEKEVAASGLPCWVLEVNPDKIFLTHLKTILGQHVKQ